MIEIFIFLAFTAFLQTECQGKLFVLKSILMPRSAPGKWAVVHCPNLPG